MWQLVEKFRKIIVFIFGGRFEVIEVSRVGYLEEKLDVKKEFIRIN